MDLKNNFKNTNFLKLSLILWLVMNDDIVVGVVAHVDTYNFENNFMKNDGLIVTNI